MNEDYNDYLKWINNQPTLTERKSHPNHWFNRASDLRASAHVLWLVMASKQVQKDIGYGGNFSLEVACFPVYQMLCGLSLELIMKAVIVQRKIPLKRTHDLNALASDLGLPMDEKRKKLFKYYKHFIEWSGRYPVPMSGKDEDLTAFWALAQTVTMTSSSLSRGSKLKFFRTNNITSWGNFDDLWCSIAELFNFNHE